MPGKSAVRPARVEQVEQARDGGDQCGRADQHRQHDKQDHEPVRCGTATRAGVVAGIPFFVRREAEGQRFAEADEP